MLLNKDRIRQKNLIQDGLDENFRNASYDLRVGRIIDHEGQEVEEIKMEPQEMLRVVSREKVVLPTHVAAYAMIKTGLCDQGILAINIGIIDPGYEGYLSSTLINFGSNKHILRAGDTFLRLTFHEHDAAANPSRTSGRPLREYIAEKKNFVVQDFSPTFLNIEATAARAAKEVVGNWWTRILVFGSVIALLITACAALGTTWSSFTATRTYIRSDQEQLKSDVKNLQDAIRDLQARVPPTAPSSVPRRP